MRTVIISTIFLFLCCLCTIAECNRDMSTNQTLCLTTGLYRSWIWSLNNIYKDFDIIAYTGMVKDVQRGTNQSAIYVIYDIMRQRLVASETILDPADEIGYKHRFHSFEVKDVNRIYGNGYSYYVDLKTMVLDSSISKNVVETTRCNNAQTRSVEQQEKRNSDQKNPSLSILSSSLADSSHWKMNANKTLCLGTSSYRNVYALHLTSSDDYYLTFKGVDFDPSDRKVVAGVYATYDIANQLFLMSQSYIGRMNNFYYSFNVPSQENLWDTKLDVGKGYLLFIDFERQQISNLVYTQLVHASGCFV
jgi:hypothetical protein